MLNLFSDLSGFALQGQDERKGTVDDVYFDDRSWTVRYVVADIGPIIFGRKALIGTELIGEPDLDQRTWPVELSKAEIESAPEPGPATAEPVSAREERRMRRQATAWPALLLGTVGAGFTPLLADQQLKEARRERQGNKDEKDMEAHLRSMAEVRGYKVRAQDDWIGTVGDFLIDPVSWKVRYIVVDTGDWLPGEPVVLPVHVLTDIDWNRGEVTVQRTREDIENSPPIESVPGLERSEEDALLAYYGAPPL